ncbi:MAG: hypothetical protein QOI20_1862, partial [Acidimicrobiaceae bacterium]|nr:hypothetical protein [Acidimicrobiaceae bacterium]
TPPATAPTPAPAPVPGRNDWATHAADTIDRVVTGIGDKTARPLTAIAAAVVFGLVIAAAATTLLVLVSIGMVRALVNYLPFDLQTRKVWVAEAITGGIFTLAGLFVWRKRRPKRS